MKIPENFGLNYEKQVIEQELAEKQVMGTRTKFGASDFPVIKKGGNWMELFLKRAPEAQFGAKLESMGCTGFGTADIIEEQIDWKFGNNINDKTINPGEKINISDRGLNKMAGTTKNGNTVDTPIDTLRKKGFLLEREWGWNKDTFTWEDFYANIYAKFLNLAKQRTFFWDFKHEYVPRNPDVMCAALETSRLGCTVYAWHRDSKTGMYTNPGFRDNHFTTILFFDYGKKWFVGDQYPHNFDYNCTDPKEYVKELPWGYPFGCLKRYAVRQKTASEKYSLLVKFKNMIIEEIKMNFYKNKAKPDLGLANGEVYITKQDPKRRKKVETIDDVVAMIEVIFAKLDIHFDKTDWGEIGQYNPVPKF